MPGVGVGVDATAGVGVGVGVVGGDELLPPHWTRTPTVAVAQRMRTAVRILT
jgi:hypothetical protein